MTRHFRRLTAADQAELALEQSLSAGKWRGLLPSYRILSTVLGFSIPTLSNAVARLVKRGQLSQRGDNRRFEITSQPTKPSRLRATKSTNKPERCLLIISPTPAEKWDEGQRRVTLEAMQGALADGWNCAQETVDFLLARRALSRWDRLILKHRPTHLLAIHGTRKIAQWAKGHDLTVACIGGERLDAETGVNIGINLGTILGHCARQLREAGHRRIVMPCWGGLRELPEFSARILGEALGLDPARLLSEGWVFGAPASTPAEHRIRLRRHMDKLRPTAIVTFDWRDHLVAVECAKQAGLRVPQDLSLIVLNPSVDTEWVTPLAAHYRIGQEFFIREVNGWRNGKPVSATSVTQAVLDGWNPGETFGRSKG